MKFRQRFQWNPANSPVRSWPGFQRCYVIAENCDRFEERPRWKPYFGACPSTSHLDTIYFCWPQPREVMIWSFILLISPGLAILSSKLNRTPSKPVDVCAVFASLMLRWWCNNKIECKRSRVGKTILAGCSATVFHLSSPKHMVWSTFDCKSAFWLRRGLKKGASSDWLHPQCPWEYEQRIRELSTRLDRLVKSGFLLRKSNIVSAGLTANWRQWRSDTLIVSVTLEGARSMDPCNKATYLFNWESH